MTYKSTNIMDAKDRAYIAGLIDGEGTITLTRKHKGENRQLAITISSTEPSLLEFVLQQSGVGKITNKRITDSRHTPSFTYCVYNRQALALLEQVHVYLKSYKAHRSRLILKNYLELTPRNGKYSDIQREARRKFETQLLNIKPGE